MAPSTWPALVLPALSASLAAHDDWMAAHDRLDAAMFWVGLMFAFTPILVGIGVGSVIWYHRRKQRPEVERTE